jgi:hypothetical protein
VPVMSSYPVEFPIMSGSGTLLYNEDIPWFAMATMLGLIAAAV